MLIAPVEYPNVSIIFLKKYNNFNIDLIKYIGMKQKISIFNFLLILNVATFLPLIVLRMVEIIVNNI